MQQVRQGVGCIRARKGYFRAIRSDLRKWAVDKPTEVREIAGLLGHQVLQLARDPLNGELARQAGHTFMALVAAHGEYRR